MICVDASIVVKAITDEEGCGEALALFKKWRKTGTDLVAPALIDYEVSSVLCHKAFVGDIKENEVIQAYRLFLELGVKTIHDPALLEKALLTARSFSQRTSYDFAYLTCAQSLDAELVTADFKFVEMVREGYSFVKFYKGY